jgi:hypothetical protein
VVVVGYNNVKLWDPFFLIHRFLLLLICALSVWIMVFIASTWWEFIPTAFLKASTPFHCVPLCQFWEDYGARSQTGITQIQRITFDKIRFIHFCSIHHNTAQFGSVSLRSDPIALNSNGLFRKLS